jgi:hypothetical protein
MKALVIIVVALIMIGLGSADMNASEGEVMSAVQSPTLCGFLLLLQLQLQLSGRRSLGTQ